MTAWSYLLPLLHPPPPPLASARPHRAGIPVYVMQLHLSVTSFSLWTLADGIPGRTTWVGTAVHPGVWFKVVQSPSAQWSAVWG